MMALHTHIYIDVCMTDLTLITTSTIAYINHLTCDILPEYDLTTSNPTSSILHYIGRIGRHIHQYFSTCQQGELPFPTHPPPLAGEAWGCSSVASICACHYRSSGRYLPLVHVRGRRK